MVAKTMEEIAEMRELIKAGHLSPTAVADYLEAERRAVFGHDYKTDRTGRPQEQGIGAPGNETEQHFTTLRKWEGAEAEKAARAAAAKRKGA